jgi:hypothetical protein
MLIGEAKFIDFGAALPKPVLSKEDKRNIALVLRA